MKEEKSRERSNGSVPGLLLGKVAHSGSRPNPNAVVSAMPRIARITSIIAVAPLLLVLRLPRQGKISVTAITFWRVCSGKCSQASPTKSAHISERRLAQSANQLTYLSKPAYADLA